ncbi:MAG: NAD(P)/FAD-dependent oxidoreductase [Desulfurococcales archaeon]|nr:NAD(P)/FAD-dependent oxidoreductase [Desulfurococcales archaeon]
MDAGNGDASVTVGGRPIKVDASKPLDVAVASRLGFKYAIRGSLVLWPYSFKPWDCGRYVWAEGTPVDIFAEAKRAVNISLEKPPSRHPKEPPTISKLEALSKVAATSIGASLSTTSVDVLIVGLGLSGLAAAEAAVERGLSVAAVDFSPSPGGYLSAIWSYSELDESKSSAEITAGIYSRLVASQRFKALLGYEYVTPLGGGRHLVKGQDGFLEVKARVVIYAHGGLDARPLLPGNWLPGIVSSDYVMRLSSLYDTRFKSLAVIGWSEWALRVAGQLASRHADRVVIVSKKEIKPGMPYYDYASRYGVELIVDRVENAKPHSDGILLEFREYEPVVVDAVVSAIGPYPEIPTLILGGADVLFSESARMIVPRLGEDYSAGPNLFAAGLAAGYLSEYATYHSGRVVGLAAASKLGVADEAEVKSEVLELMKDPRAADLLVEQMQGSQPVPPSEPEALVASGISHGELVDACSWVDAEEFESALRRFRSLEAAVAFTGALHGLDAGRESFQTIVQFASTVLGLSPQALRLREIVPSNSSSILGIPDLWAVSGELRW